MPAGWQGDKILPRFKVRERVVIFSRAGVAIHGTVKWAGKYSLQDRRRKPHSVAAVGIETVGTVRYRGGGRGRGEGRGGGGGGRGEGRGKRVV